MEPQAAVTGTAEWLQTYGPWAVVVLCLGGMGILWRALSAARTLDDTKDEKHREQLERIGKEHREQLERIGKEHKVEMATLLDRIVAGSNTQVDKFSGLAEQSARVVEALTRRVRKPGRAGTVSGEDR